MNSIVRLELTEREFNTLRDIVNSRKLELSMTAQRFAEVVTGYTQSPGVLTSVEDIQQAEFAVRRCNALQNELIPILDKFSKTILV